MSHSSPRPAAPRCRSRRNWPCCCLQLSSQATEPDWCPTSSVVPQAHTRSNSPCGPPAKVPGLSRGLRFHDLRHDFASLLIADGLDVKTVQVRLRHASAKTTLDVYGLLWPDKDEATRATVAAAIRTRSESPAESLRNHCGIPAESPRNPGRGNGP
ncbi:tyrosine-type recombinase/integrase [uncultured Jatrophihabitans sp.]|uniref:tyrosine-type recombinase/integrase n=1 Tax=uncultured Jatrophihabitans sp. TaxID=1610747 RepID=UPI0035CB23D1